MGAHRFAKTFVSRTSLFSIAVLFTTQLHTYIMAIHVLEGY